MVHTMYAQWGIAFRVHVRVLCIYSWLTKVTEHSHVTTNHVDTMPDRIQALLDINGGPY